MVNEPIFTDSEALLAAIVGSADDAIYSKSIDAILTSWNPAAERLYGYTPEEAVGSPVAMLIPRHRAGEEKRILEQILAGDRIDHFDTERVRKDGTIIPVSITVSPVRDRQGTVIGASTIARSIAERKQIEEIKDRFIANAAHELRTPLTTLSALTSALAANWETIGPDKRQELLSAMDRQGERARLLINNLLELSQLENARLLLNIEGVDVGAVVTAALEGAPAPEGKTVRVKIPERVIAKADRVRLSQVVTNLLTNSYRYGGSKIDVAVEQRARAVLIAVSDDGPGVPRDLVEEIFHPFTRGPSSGSHQGSGLGLAISKGLVEAFDGHLSYRPLVPHGARFEIRLKKHD